MSTYANTYMELRDKVLNHGAKLTADEISLIHRLKESYDDYILNLEANEYTADRNFGAIPNEQKKTTKEFEKEELFQAALKVQEEELGLMKR